MDTRLLHFEKVGQSFCISGRKSPHFGVFVCRCAVFVVFCMHDNVKKVEDTHMKKRLISFLLVVCLCVCLLPVTALAAAVDISVENAVYYSSGALQSVDAKFDWSTGGATVQLVLMTERLRSAGEAGTYATYGDFTDFGFYGSSFTNREAAQAHDAQYHTFGFKAFSDAKTVADSSSGHSLTFNFAETDIPLSVNETYYVYLWTTYGGHYYPDNLFCVIKVQDGSVQYTEATDRNSYDNTKFESVQSKEPSDVTVTPADHMTKVSGNESQTGLLAEMTPVVYKADQGYEFPESYAVNPVNGIMVRRDSAEQITVYGTPTDDAVITLIAPSPVDASGELPSEPEQDSSSWLPLFGTGCACDGYVDVDGNAWYHEAVDYVLESGLMSGTAENTFAPNGTMTRAMVWTVLGRLAGQEFTGTGANWYADAQRWAVWSGVSDGGNPNGAITREELVTMLWRFVGQPTAAENSLHWYYDSAAVSDWAADAMAWAVDAMILQGTNSNLNPQSTALRAQVAAILMRYLG